MAKRKATRPREASSLSMAVVALVAILAVIVIGGGTSATGYAATRVPASVAGTGITVAVPPHALELAPGLFFLGTSFADGKAVEGYMFVDHRPGFGHKPRHNPPGGGGGGGGGGGSGDRCFAPIVKGAVWRETEGYVLNTANSDGMSAAFVESNIAASLDAWDAEVGFDVFGAGTTTGSLLVADETAPDGKNEVYFGSISGTGSIAVTIVWGIFSGPPSGRELVEWDIVFDDAEFKFGDAGPTSETSLGDTSVMDLLNIATHEGGHAAGLGHPSDGCTEETMYRFAGFGETKKRTLNSGDIAGINDLYA